MDFLVKIGLNFKNKQLYEEAITHTSYSNEHNLDYDYEKLEFLGDAIVEFVVSEYLFLNKLDNEGVMTKNRANYVCENALYEYACSIGLNKEIKIGNGEIRYNKTIIADVFEAFIGALYLDQGFDVVKTLVIKIVSPFIEKNINFLKDYKSELQEYVQTSKNSVIYEVIDERGPSHSKVFKVVAKVNDIILGTGMGQSKKEAEQNAAKDALKRAAK